MERRISHIIIIVDPNLIKLCKEAVSTEQFGEFTLYIIINIMKLTSISLQIVQ
jgi:hypothetical protein